MDNPDLFKRVGFTTLEYTADLAAIDATKLPIIRFASTYNVPINVIIEGATIYKVNYNNGAIIATPYTDSVSFSDVGNSTVAFAFLPTRPNGVIRITNTGGTLLVMQAISAANNAIKINVDPTELNGIQSLFATSTSSPTGYAPRFNLIGDVNGLSSPNLTTLSLSTVNTTSNFRNPVLNKKFPETLTLISINGTMVKMDIDLDTLPTSLINLDIRNNIGVRLFGDASKLLAVKDSIVLKDNQPNNDITGSLNGLSTQITVLDVVLPNIGAGYTSRTFTKKPVAFYISARKVPATDFDLLLSDLANSPIVTGTAIKISSRTSASDASVATLVSRGCTVVIA